MRRAIPSPKFKTASVTEVLRKLKAKEICKATGEPYRRVYMWGKLNTLNTLANKVLGAGCYTIKHFSDDWYYIGLLDGPGCEPIPDLPSFKLLTVRWSKEDDETVHEGDEDGCSTDPAARQCESPQALHVPS